MKAIYEEIGPKMAVGFSSRQQQHFKLRAPYFIVITILYACFLSSPVTQAASNTTITSNGSSIVNDQLLENQTPDSFGESTADQTKEDSIESLESINHSQEIDINSIDDGLLTADKAERHHYDQQQQQQPQQQQALTTEKPALISQSEHMSVDTTKPEPRNQQDQQAEQIIIDHRPLEQQQGNFVDQQELQMDTEIPPITQPPQLSGTQSNREASESNLHPTFAGSNTSDPTSTFTNIVRYNQVVVPSTQTAGSSTTSWRSSPQLSYYQRQQRKTETQQQQHQFSQSISQAQSQPATNQQAGQQSTMSAASSSFGPIVSSASNQVIAVQQYPTSINSIINDQQPVQFSASLAQPATHHQHQMSTSGGGNLIKTNQQQMVSLNGQPASVVLVSPSGTSNGAGGGRRISIAGWLRGISNMLANIFNRRDHSVQLNGQSSSPIGHWIQLGPNAPHWLSQAQTLLHNQQQMGAASSNRYATFVQAPQQQQQPQAMTITLQPATILTGNNSNQQQGVTTSPVAAVAGGSDLQASSSSPTYTLVQIPVQQQQQVPIAQYNQQSMISSPQQPTASQHQVIVGGPSSIAQASDLHTIATQQAGLKQVEQQHQAVNKQTSLVPTSTQASASGVQPHQQQGLQAANADNYHQQQSIAWSTPVVLYQKQQQQAIPTSAPQTQTRHINKSPILMASGSNLPLAHYSRFASSSSD